MAQMLDTAEQSISEGGREMLCRVNQYSSSFAAPVAILARTAHIMLSNETARQVIEAEGKQVSAQMRGGRLGREWRGYECTTAQGTSRLYLGCDGVKIPLVTAAEKKRRREEVRLVKARLFETGDSAGGGLGLAFTSMPFEIVAGVAEEATSRTTRPARTTSCASSRVTNPSLFLSRRLCRSGSPISLAVSFSSPLWSSCLKRSANPPVGRRSGANGCCPLVTKGIRVSKTHARNRTALGIMVLILKVLNRMSLP